MAIWFWAITGIALLALFKWMWNYAGKIEERTLEEEQWLQHIKKVREFNPEQAELIWEEFEKEFLN